jgi:phage head-tail adaptor, putative, SPP1 family
MIVWLQPGDFNRKITIQKKDGFTVDENGDKQPNWINAFPNISASININSGKEFWASRKENAEWDGLFKIQYSKVRSAIDTTMQVVYGKDGNGNDRIFDIIGVSDPLEAHREIWIEAKEVI